MADFHYQEMFELGADETPYRKIEGDFVETIDVEGRTLLKIDPEALVALASEAIRDVSHLFRPGHLQQLAKILEDPEASDNDRFVALELMKNANISAGMILPSCQDTGTAIVVAKKGQDVWVTGADAEALSRGIHKTYTETNLRYSQLAPMSMYEEKNTGSNLPAQLDLYATEGDEYKFLFITKGGGSANKTFWSKDPGNRPARVTLQAIPGRTVRVRPVDATGAPALGARVKVFDVDSNGFTTPRERTVKQRREPDDVIRVHLRAESLHTPTAIRVEHDELDSASSFS